jgi:hypothetical protein
MEIKQIWEVVYRVGPTLSKSEEFGGYNFEIINGETYVTKIYEKIIKLEEKRVKSKYVKKEPPLNESKNDQQMIRNILLKRMLFTGSFSRITVEPEFSLKNQQELEDQGFILTKEVRTSVTFGYDILDIENDYLSTCEDFWTSGFKGKFNGLEEEVLFISDWIEKSVVENQPVQSFMLLWVAFNCIYDIFSEKTKLTGVKKKNLQANQKIEISIQNLLKESDITNILGNHKNELNTLISYNLLVPKVEDSQYDTLCNVMRCIYKIRNKLFHQGSLNTNIGPQASVAKTLLLSVTTKMLKNMVQFT